jgi:hypothetical protein
MTGTMMPITSENLKAQDLQQLDTWPFLPSSILPKSERNVVDTSNISRDVSEWGMKALDKVEASIRDFQENQKLVISWLLTAFIAVAGTFTVNSLFGQIGIVNWGTFAVGVLFFVIVILFFFVYWWLDIKFSVYWRSPSSMFLVDHSFRPSIDTAQLTPRASILFNIRDMDSGAQLVSPKFYDLLTEYTFLICMAEIKDSLSKLKLRYIKIKIKDFRRFNPQKLPFFLISVGFRNSFKAMRPRVSDRAELELREVVGALERAQISFGVRAFDYSAQSWAMKGTQFLNEISSWDIDRLEKDLIRKICS